LPPTLIPAHAQKMTQQTLADKMGYTQQKLAYLKSGLVKSPETEDILD
jgi:transcriptional regulator with XRE-family HTH domain